MVELAMNMTVDITTTVFVRWDMMEHTAKRTYAHPVTCLHSVQTGNANVAMVIVVMGMTVIKIHIGQEQSQTRLLLRHPLLQHQSQKALLNILHVHSLVRDVVMNTALSIVAHTATY